MGMDVYGKKPTSETGKYFRASVWTWRPLAEYVQEMAPVTTAHCQHWDTNDGDGLNALDSNTLANVLQSEINSGCTALYVAKRNEELNALPDEFCDYCDVGITTQRVADKYPAYASWVGKPCKQCGGKGTKRPWATHYPLDVETVQEFVNFLRDSGGFKIY